MSMNSVVLEFMCGEKYENMNKSLSVAQSIFKKIVMSRKTRQATKMSRKMGPADNGYASHGDEPQIEAGGNQYPHASQIGQAWG